MCHKGQVHWVDIFTNSAKAMMAKTAGTFPYIKAVAPNCLKCPGLPVCHYNHESMYIYLSYESMSCKDCSEIKNNPTSKKTATTKDESRWSWFGILPLLFLGVTEEQQLGRETPQKVGVSHLNLKHLHLSKQALHKLLIRKTISTSSI